MQSHRPLKVLVLNDLLPPDSEGGMELSAWELGKGLEELGHEVHWACSEWRSSYKGAKEESVKVHRILKRAELPLKAENKLQAFNAIGQKINVAADNYDILETLLRELDFDVALIFGMLAIGLGSAHVFTDNGIPILWSVGDVAIPVHFDLPNRTAVYRAAFSTVGRKWHARERSLDFSHILFTSNFVKEEFVKAGIEPKHWGILPRALDFEPQMGEKEDPPLILLASRLTKARGIHTALEAAQILSKAKPDCPWKLEIVGGGDASYLSDLRTLAEQVNRPVTFTGQVSRKEALSRMARASIVINPTIEPEGFGRTNIEAMASGAVLVATDVPSIHDIIDGYDCAETFPGGDAKALAILLKNLLEDPIAMTAIAARGSARSRDFGMDSVLATLEIELELLTCTSGLKQQNYKRNILGG